MSMNYGDETPVEPAIMRDRNWPCLRQFGVFMENRVGRLHDVLRHVEKHDLQVIGLSIVDSIDYVVVRLILSEYERGRELFELSQFTVFENDIIGVVLPDSDQPFLDICTALLQAEVNIHYSYPLLFRPRGRGAIALLTDDVDQGVRALSEKGLKLVTEKDMTDEQY